MSKSPDAFRTISEVAEWLAVQAHVLRFWESKFPQLKPVKRAGGRRYYRPADMLLLGGIRYLLHDKGLSIKEVQTLLRENGAAYLSDMSHSLDEPFTPGSAGPKNGADLGVTIDSNAGEPAADDAPVAAVEAKEPETSPAIEVETPAPADPAPQPAPPVSAPAPTPSVSEPVAAAAPSPAAEPVVTANTEAPSAADQPVAAPVQPAAVHPAPAAAAPVETPSAAMPEAAPADASQPTPAASTSAEQIHLDLGPVASAPQESATAKAERLQSAFAGAQPAPASSSNPPTARSSAPAEAQANLWDGTSDTGAATADAPAAEPAQPTLAPQQDLGQSDQSSVSQPVVGQPDLAPENLESSGTGPGLASVDDNAADAEAEVPSPNAVAPVAPPISNVNTAAPAVTAPNGAQAPGINEVEEATVAPTEQVPEVTHTAAPVAGVAVPPSPQTLAAPEPSVVPERSPASVQAPTQDDVSRAALPFADTASEPKTDTPSETPAAAGFDSVQTPAQPTGHVSPAVATTDTPLGAPLADPQQSAVTETVPAVEPVAEDPQVVAPERPASPVATPAPQPPLAPSAPSPAVASTPQPAPAPFASNAGHPAALDNSVPEQPAATVAVSPSDIASPAPAPLPTRVEPAGTDETAPQSITVQEQPTQDEVPAATTAQPEGGNLPTPKPGVSVLKVPEPGFSVPDTGEQLDSMVFQTQATPQGVSAPQTITPSDLVMGLPPLANLDAPSPSPASSDVEDHPPAPAPKARVIEIADFDLSDLSPAPGVLRRLATQSEIPAQNQASVDQCLADLRTLAARG
ncbi:MerR family transcriptional regulator [Epibacterium sp. SM1979]|uniref:MerR family transcriptional regulator n=1 Tax=Tritonibacter litoralis TaxID=2662264 RepID=A0A843YE59_9RHOB|nr:MerR family transcriptional regulator [Tritonibacter litoralis]MQQ07379.1 MerR family transcriptional regulator [Tritonibacter litoralis]